MSVLTNARAYVWTSIQTAFWLLNCPAWAVARAGEKVDSISNLTILD